MLTSQPTALWLNVGRSSPRTPATRRRLIRQFEFLDVLGNPDVVGLTEVHCSAVAVWRDWAQARGYHVVCGRLVDRLPSTALLLTRRDRTSARSQRAASTPRRTPRGLASWLEVQSATVELDGLGPTRVGNVHCLGSYRTALNFLQSSADSTPIVVGGDFNLAYPTPPRTDVARSTRDEVRWIRSHSTLVDVPTGSAHFGRHILADAASAAAMSAHTADAADADGKFSRSPVLAMSCEVGAEPPFGKLSTKPAGRTWHGPAPNRNARCVRPAE